jgi:hypothetical protein
MSGPNSAVVRYFGTVRNFAPEHWDEVLVVNLSAPYHSIRLALPGMNEKHWRRVINMASIYGLIATVDRVDHVTTKTALIGLTRVRRWKSRGPASPAMPSAPARRDTRRRLAPAAGCNVTTPRLRKRNRISWRGASRLAVS